jgi:MOSC domain-containing protein YiiM
MFGVEPETCPECGFDAASWTVADAASLLDALGEWWRLATRGVAADQLSARPEPGVWSALEYGFHSALVTAVLREGVERILADNGCSLPEPPELAAVDNGPGLRLDATDVIDGIQREGAALATVARGAAPDRWDHVGRRPDWSVSASFLLLHSVHDATHHQLDVGRGLSTLGAGTPRAAGVVGQINVSGGGVPKHPVAHAVIDHGGVAGDTQADRVHHGRPFQALCLWSVEVLDQLAAAGHPIGPGRAGENLTLAGLPWAELRPGARLRVGTALAELSFPATPCAKQAGWFTDRDFRRIEYQRAPERARWYAWVREPGDVRVGDSVTLQPPE